MSLFKVLLNIKSPSHHFSRKLVIADEKFSKLSVHVALDCQLAKDELQSPSSSFQPLLIIVPVRLGLNELNPIYIDGLKRCLELESSVGFIGGLIQMLV